MTRYHHGREKLNFQDSTVSDPCSTWSVSSLLKLDENEAYRQLDSFFTHEARRFDLMEVLGIRDEEILERFLDLGFTASTARAIEMAPFAFVAWASSRVTDAECAATVTAVHDSQLSDFPKILAVVQSWLDVQPRPEIWELWVRYLHCRLEQMSPSERAGLHCRLTEQATRIARASGGWLGIGSICRQEQVIIDAIDLVFEGGIPAAPLSTLAESRWTWIG